MFIDFEGIDGSGKTTLSNLLAARLKKLGYRVTHAREGGELQSPLARRVRELTRDARHLEMGRRTEFFLNLARDAQQLEEVVAPALRRGDVVLTDRYLYSQLALTAGGRGLDEALLRPVTELAAQGHWPDLVILVDVDPDLARWRKRLGKLKGDRALAAGASESRKGLAGFGLSVRVREHFLDQARRDPGRWVVLENNDTPLWVLEQRLVDAVVARLEHRDGPVQPVVPPRARASTSGAHAALPTVDTVEARFQAALDALETREPALAAFLLAGAPGPAFHKRRVDTLPRFPELVARSLGGLEDAPSWALREHLAEHAPVAVAESLPTDGLSERALALRERLYPRAPEAVLAGLKRDDSERAWALRARGLAEGRLLAVLAGLAGVDSPRAWEVREQGAAARAHADVARSLGGLTSERAEALREALLKHDRLAVLRSTTGLDTPFAQGLREQLAPLAPKVVLRTLKGLTSEHAFALREAGALHTKEAIDSLDGLDHPRAWALREASVGRWPATVLSSLAGLPASPRATALVARALAAAPDRLSVVRAAALALARGRAVAEELAAQPPAARAEGAAAPQDEVRA